MSKESAIQFLEKLRENDRVAEILKNKEVPKNKKEQAKLFAEIAKELGETISAEDFDEALEEIEAAMRQRTGQSVSDMEALEDDNLDNVAGGTEQSGKQNSWCDRLDIVVALKEWGCSSVSA